MRQHLRQLSDVEGRHGQRRGGLNQIVLLGFVERVGLGVMRLAVLYRILDERKAGWRGGLPSTKGAVLTIRLRVRDRHNRFITGFDELESKEAGQMRQA